MNGARGITTKNKFVVRDWGFYQVLYDREFKVKILTVMPHKHTSIQRHNHRNEHWVFTGQDKYQFVPVHSVHQLRNDSDKPMKVVEIQTGEYFGEDDIERL